MKPIKITTTNVNKIKIIHKHEDAEYVNDYKKLLSTYKVNQKLSIFFENVDANHWMFGFPNRYHMMHTMAFDMNIDTTHTIVALYKIKDITQTEKEVIYAMAYINRRKHNEYVDFLEKSFNNHSLGENIYIQHVCASGSVVSRDGEYRSGMLNWSSVSTLLERKPLVHKIFNHIVDHFKDTLKERKYILLTDYCFPTTKIKNTHQYETEMLCSSTKVEFFCVMWFNFFYSYFFGFISNHLNDTFKGLLLRYKKEDIEFFKNLWELFPYNLIEELRFVLGNDVWGHEDELHIYEKRKLGQKVIPLNLIEAQHFFNLQFDPWKELYINTKVSDLVVNNVTNGFALARTWFLIKNRAKKLFDNPSQADRVDKSEIALKIAEILSQAKVYTFHNINKKEDAISDSDVLNYDLSGEHIDITSWLSNEFKTLYTKIQEAINHAKSRIILSNVSLCLVTEFVGKTLYDAIFFSKKSSYYKILVSDILLESNYRTFRKYMFQICYNLLCLNTKLHIIHGDLHLNNVTLNSIFYKKNVQIPHKDPKILYILDESTYFMYPQNFYDICLIDFSRAIINPHHVDDFKISTIPYDLISSRNKFQDTQIDHITDYLLSTKPDFIEFRANIGRDIKAHFNEYFKVLSVLDIYNLTSKFIAFIKCNECHIKAPYKGCIKLVDNLNKSADYYLSSVLNKLITRHNYEEVDRMDWPIEAIIRDVFEDDIIATTTDISQVIDVYNYTADNTKHSLNNHKQFPNVLKTDKQMMKYVAKYDVDTFANYQQVDLIVKRHKEKY